jgi:tape measure domain-containing protein
MTDYNLAIKFTTQGGQIVVKDLQQMDAAADKVNQSLGATGQSGAVAQQGFKKASGGADVLTSSLKGMVAQALGIIGLGAAFKSLVSTVVEVGNVTQGWNAAMQAITGSQQSANQELQHSRDLALRLGLDIESTTASYVQFTAATSGTALEGEKTATVFDAISSSMRVLNRSSAQTEGALKALEQMVSKGNVQAEELRGQLGERLPGAFNLAADAMGVTTKELNKMLENGNVLAADLLPKLADVLTKKYGPGLAVALNSPAQSFRNLKNETFEFSEALSNVFFDDFAEVAQGAADGLGTFADHLPEVIALLSTLGEIVMIGGVAYLGLKALPLVMVAASNAAKALAFNVLAASMAFKAGVTPLALFTGGVRASAVATMEAVVATGLLKSAVLGLFAAYAGWEIGSYLTEQFSEVRIAGLAFVGAMETGLVNLSYAFSAIAPKAQQIWSELTTWLKNKLGALYSLIGDGLAKIGADDMAQGYHNFAAGLNGTSDAASKAKEELAALEAQRLADIATVDSTIVSLINLEYAQANVNETTKKKPDTKPQTVAELTSNQQLIAALGQQIVALGQTAKQKLINANLSKLSADATSEEIEAVRALSAAQYAQIQLADNKQSDLDYYKNVIDGANDISDSWSTAGNVIVNTFGTIGEQLDKLAKQQESYAKKQQKLALDRIKYAGDPKQLEEIGKAENALAQQKDRNAISEISSYRAISDSAASMFSENSKGREAMQAASNVFTVIEQANSAMPICSYAIEAVAAAFAAPWPIGFASGAAMIAIMAGLGVAVSGGSGSAPMSAEQRQQTQATGTVMGSNDKSGSILNSYERSEDLQLDQYAVLVEMSSSLNDLNYNITNLVANLVISFGRFDGDSYGGQLGKTSKYNSNGHFQKVGENLGGFLGDPLGGLIDSLIGSFNTTKKSLTDSGISIVSQTLGDVITNGALQAQAYFDIETEKKSFWGLVKKTSYNTEYQDVSEQLQYEMALVFESIGSSIYSAVDVLGLDVTNNLENFVISLPNISLKDLSGDAIQSELEAIFSSQADLMATYLMPGLREFQKVGEGLYETLIRLAQEQAVFNAVLEITGNTLDSIDATQTIEATQAIIDFAGGIENLQSAASDFFNGFYDETEQFAFNQKQLTAQFAAIGEELPATADLFKKLVSELDPLNVADQKRYAQLLLLSGQAAEYYDALEDLEEAKREDILATKEAIAAEQELARERAAAITSLKSDIEQLADNLLNPGIDYQSLIKEEEQRWKNQQNAADKLYATEMQRYQGALNAEKTLDEYINGLAFSENSTMSAWQQQSLARSQFNDAVSRAGAGDYSAVADATSSASQYLDIGKQRYGGDSDMYRDMFKFVNTSLSDLSDFYANFEAPEQQIIEESPELLSLRAQLAAAEAAAQQAENQALADLLTSQLTELSALSGDSIDSLIDSFSFDISTLSEVLNVNLLELIEVTKQSTDVVLNTDVATVPTDNVVPFPGQTIAPVPTIATPQTTASTAKDNEMLAELKLLRQEVAAFREDSNNNADDAFTQRKTGNDAAETQAEEIVNSNLRQIGVG